MTGCVELGWKGWGMTLKYVNVYILKKIKTEGKPLRWNKNKWTCVSNE